MTQEPKIIFCVVESLYGVRLCDVCHLCQLHLNLDNLDSGKEKAPGSTKPETEPNTKSL